MWLFLLVFLLGVILPLVIKMSSVSNIASTGSLFSLTSFLGSGAVSVCRGRTAPLAVLLVLFLRGYGGSRILVF